VISDDEYAALAAQEGATIITGKVVVNNDEQLAILANVKMIGSDLSIYGGTSISFPALENVSGRVELKNIMDVDGAATSTIVFDALKSVGGDFLSEENPGLMSIDAPELVLIYERLSITDNVDALESLTLPSLDIVGAIEINNESFKEYGPGALTTIELSQTNVSSNVDVMFSGYMGDFTLGNIGGDIYLYDCKFSSFGATNIELHNLTIYQCYEMSVLNFDNLVKIDGNLELNQNSGDRYPATVDGELSLSGFDNLEEITGYVLISGNNFGEEMIGFNALTKVSSGSNYYDDNIVVQSNNSHASIEIFNGLVNSGNINIIMVGETKLFDSFQKLEQAKNIYLDVRRESEYSFATWSEDWVSDQCVVKGFDVLTSAWEINIKAKTITGFDAFNSYADEFGNVKITLPVEDALAETQVLATNVYMCSLKPHFDLLDPTNTEVFTDPISGMNTSVAEGLSYVYSATECGN
ncbi:MAG: hypothetical protein MI866_04475, partial [Bacteroidales bacterium]|nr:hypothetical protein [Bacteroidales bacterium]